jgi:hypothetical protein
MYVVGRRYSTWVDAIDGVDYVWKSMDVAPPGREPSLCFREFLGFCLGSRLGLAVPATELRCDRRYGRVSVQRLIVGSRAPMVEEQRAVATSTSGVRILLLDLVIRNPDRRAANLLLAGNTVFPIDFNVAFDFDGDGLAYAEFRDLIMRWIGLPGVLRLLPTDRACFQEEARRMEHLLSTPYLTYTLNLVDDRFLSADDRTRLRLGLERRRDAVGPMLERWWHETVRPLHRLLVRETPHERERPTAPA